MTIDKYDVIQIGEIVRNCAVYSRDTTRQCGFAAVR